jgi:hypothetical protein
MGKQREWGTWPRRISDQLNGVSGIAGVGGAVVSAAGWGLLAGLPATILTVTGLGIAALASGYALKKSIPPKIKSAVDFVGIPTTLDEILKIQPRIPTLSIVGPSQAGKTTLKQRLNFDDAANARTQQIVGDVVSLQTTPPSYFALLDGGGEKFAQQFKLAEACDCLCLVVDHNISDTAADVDLNRLSQIRELMVQTRHYLDEQKSSKKEWIHILVNKHDLWKNATDTQRTEFEHFCRDEISKWEVGQRAKIVTYHYHSNEFPDDVAHFMRLLKQTTIN